MRRNQKDQASESGSTIIGPSLSFKGEITGEEDLTVQGQVEGTIDLKKTTLPSAGPGASKQMSMEEASLSKKKSRAISLGKKGLYFGNPGKFVEI